MENITIIEDFGTKVPKQELYETFPADEGDVQLIYGRIRNGKSTEAVRRMYVSLTRGVVVYSNIRLDLLNTVFDDRFSISTAGKNFLLNEKRFYVFRKENFRYFNPATGEMICNGVSSIVFDPQRKGAEVEWLNSLTDCEIYYDEGQWLLDSYESTNASIAKRKLITETGHVNRRIVIIAQRTQSVHVNARGNVNQFFRCQKVYKYFFFRALQVEEFQDMRNNDVDEDAEPVSIRTYYMNGKYWKLFNTHYLRAGRPKSQEVYFDAYDLTFKERAELLPVLLFERMSALLGKPFKRLSQEGAFAPEKQSLGVESTGTTIKKGERLNTVPLGGNDSTAESDQESLPF